MVQCIIQMPEEKSVLNLSIQTKGGQIPEGVVSASEAVASSVLTVMLSPSCCSVCVCV